MQIYPAMKARMGDWSYYMVRMRMKEVAHEVRLASDLWEDRTLSQAIQRAVDESRVKRQITAYLSGRPDRFFGSLVVAAIGGNPSWTPVEPAEKSGMAGAFEGVFGTLMFVNDPRYFALDGQHRLRAIQELLADPEGVPPGFSEEQVSVLVVVREEQHLDDELWLQRYRRLFSSLNRYAKPTGRDTNIIMDEDDLYAIVTRRLITDHEFFRFVGSERRSPRVQMKGKQLKEGAAQFTSLQTLYSMNRTFLRDVKARASWAEKKKEKTFLQVRPNEDVVDRRYDHLAAIWDALLEALPVLREDPGGMKFHSVPFRVPDGSMDNLLFWPIGQELMATAAREMLDKARLPAGSPVDKMAEALRPLADLPWDLHEAPWRYLLLVPKDAHEYGWKMRSEDRKVVLGVAARLLRWMLMLDSLDEQEEGELRQEWHQLLRPFRQEDDDPAEPAMKPGPEDMWQQVGTARDRIASA